MDENETFYVNDLSPEERELLEIGRKIRDAGQDPVRILNYYLEARGTATKAAELGKQAQGFFLKRWEELEKAFKDQDGKLK